MRDIISDALNVHGARYVEIRLGYRGRELEGVGRTTGIGGNVRTLAVSSKK